MTVAVRIPASLQQLTQHKTKVEAGGANIKYMFDDLERKFPGFKSAVYDKNKTLHTYINIYVNDEDIRFLQQSETLLKDGDTVLIIPAIAGG